MIPLPKPVRRRLAFLLVGIADALLPDPGLGVLSNRELDVYLARRRRLRKQAR